MNCFTAILSPLMRVVEGDLSYLDQLLGYPHATIEQAFHQAEQLFLTRAAVLNVLTGLKEGTLDPKTVQQWASLMRRGYVGRATEGQPVRPVEIEYEPEFEGPISEVLSRLDELGDIIDGEIDQNELTELTMLFK